MFSLASALAFLLIASSQAASVAAAACPRPQYPSTSRNVEGKIDAKYVVGSDGSVGDIEIVTPHPDTAFAAATVAALRECHLPPTMKDGVAVNTSRTRTFFFTPPDAFPVQLGVDEFTKRRVNETGPLAITIDAGRSWVLSLPLFADFELTGEVRIPNTAEASLLVRAWPNRYAPPGVAYEIALGNDRKHVPGTVNGRGLKLTMKAHDTAAAEAYRGAAGTWQPIRVEAIDRSLSISLAGRTVAEAELLDAFAGRLGLDVAKGSIEIRDFRVRRLDRYRESVPLEVLYPDARVTKAALRNGRPVRCLVEFVLGFSLPERP